MLYLPITRPSLAQNLALEEALLENAEAAADEAAADEAAADEAVLQSPGSQPQPTSQSQSTSQSKSARPTAVHEYLRTWEASTYAVVLGRSSSVRREVHMERCTAESIPMLRRCSGGASVVIGPGCLMYAVMLDLRKRPELRPIDAVHRFVMDRIRHACLALDVPVVFQGTCDLTIDQRKFSGNSVRCKRNHTLYHGTLLYDFDLTRIPELLKEPPRQPDYRAQRRHESFVTNLSHPQHRITREQLCASLQQAWDAFETVELPPDEREIDLTESRYDCQAWTLKIA